MPLIALLEQPGEGAQRPSATALPRTIILPIRQGEDAQSLVDRIQATPASSVLLRGLPKEGLLIRLAADGLPAIVILSQADWECAQREAAEGLPRARELWLAHAVFAPSAPLAWPADVPPVALRLLVDEATAETTARTLLEEFSSQAPRTRSSTSAGWLVSFTHALQSGDSHCELRSFRSQLKVRSEGVRAARPRLLILSGEPVLGTEDQGFQAELEALKLPESPFEVIAFEGIAFAGKTGRKLEREPAALLQDLERLLPDLVVLRGSEAAAFGRTLTWLGWPIVLWLGGSPTSESHRCGPSEGIRASLRAIPSCVVFGESTAEHWSPFVRIPKLARLSSARTGHNAGTFSATAAPSQSLCHFLEQQLIKISAIGARPPFAGPLARSRAVQGYGLLQASEARDAAAFRRALRALADMDRPAPRPTLLNRLGSFWKSFSARA